MNEDRSADLELAFEEGVEELKQAYNHLLAKDRHKMKYIENVAQDLCLPVTNLNLYLKLLKDGRPEKKEYYISVMGEQVARLLEIVSGMVEFSETDQPSSQGEGVQAKSDNQRVLQNKTERLAIL